MKTMAIPGTIFLLLFSLSGTAFSSEWADSVLATLSLEQKVGQLVFPELRPGSSPGFLNDSIWSEAAETVDRYGVGGFVLFGGSFPTVIGRIAYLQSVSPVPLLITSDLETGAGQKISGMTHFPPNMALGAAGSETLARDAGFITARQARKVGIGMTFSPVMDINSNPANPIINVRSFGEDPALVCTLGESYIKGCAEGRLLTTAKHFPGHGDTEADSHTGLPVISKDREKFERTELLPFRCAIEAGVDAIMTGHLSVPSLDSSGTPASLSAKIIQGLLRREMGFDGLVITDALVMDAVNDRDGKAAAGKRALIAGADILLMPESVSGCVNSVLQAVRDGEITEKSIDAHVKRILEAKAKLRTSAEPVGETESGNIAELLLRGEEAAHEMARRSITLLADVGKIVPFEKGSGSIFTVTMRGDSLLSEASSFHRMMKKELGDRYSSVSLLPGTDRSLLEETVKRAQRADVVIVLAVSRVRAYRGYPGLPAGLLSLARTILAHEKGVIVSLGNPYLISDLPESSCTLIAYGTDQHSQQAAAGALLGLDPVTGTLPVSIPGRYKIGSGLSTDTARHVK